MRYYDFQFGRLFVGNSKEELAQAIEHHLNPPPVVAPTPKRKGRR